MTRSFFSIFSNDKVKRFWFPAVLFGILLSVYGQLLIKPGIFWDDWQVVYLNRFSSPNIWWDYFLYDRPISIWTYLLMLPVIGVHPLAWVLFSVVIRWVGILCFCYVLSSLWPGRAWQVHWIGVLLAVFPGFRLQGVSIAFSQHFITLALFTASLAWMVAAVRRPNRRGLYLLLSLIAGLGHSQTMEYFVPLELLRPVLLWYLFAREVPRRTRLLKTIRYSLFFLLIPIAFVVWRFWYYPRIAPIGLSGALPLLENLLKTPLSSLERLANLSLSDFIYVTFFSWAKTFSPDTIQFNAVSYSVSWLVGVVVAILAGVFLSDHGNPQADEADRIMPDHFHRQAIFLGILTILFGGMPIWMTDRTATYGAWSDRFTLAPMFGAVIFIVALVDWFLRDRKRKTLFLAALLCVSVAAQFRMTNRYRNDWNNQRSYYWQLLWRAPALEPYTTILGPELPFSFVGNYSIGFALDTIYNPRPTSFQPRHWWVYAAPRLAGSKEFPGFIESAPIEYDELRNIRFKSSTDQSLFVTKDDSYCLLVFSDLYRGFPLLLKDQDTFLVSHPEQIISHPGPDQRPDPSILGKELPHDWCYYFEKADLAYQEGDFATVAALRNEALAKGFKPSASFEYMPFIAAYVQAGEWDKAADDMLAAHTMLVKIALEPTEPSFCKVWQRITKNAPDSPAKEEATAKIKSAFNCAEP